MQTRASSFSENLKNYIYIPISGRPGDSSLSMKINNHHKLNCPLRWTGLWVGWIKPFAFSVKGSLTFNVFFKIPVLDMIG